MERRQKMEEIIVGVLVVLGGLFLAVLALLWLLSLLFPRTRAGERREEMLFAPGYSEFARPRHQPVSLPQMLFGALLVWFFSDE
jgi:hypothetical protein